MKIRKLFVAALMLLSAGTAVAQQMPPIPVDKDVKIGHLDNGLTYYIRHNAYPEKVASFYIAQKVGSINENDDQRGLAHLLEHLAFNGTDHFKGNSLQDYLQSIGVEYGRNLNAMTSIDRTVYFFTDVPTVRTTAVDSCMLILKDWSNGISLTEQAINDERDVVHNEYRMRIVGQQRILERALPALYPGSKYGERFPIGLMSIIDGCSPETLRAYYRKWYRPDNQAIIVVGDIDVNHIEEQIKKLFSDIKVPADAAKVLPEAVPDNNEPIFVIDKDKEMQTDIFAAMMKHDATPDSEKGSIGYLAQQYLNHAVTGMLNTRLFDYAKEPECPYLQAYAAYDDYLLSRVKESFSLTGLPKPGKMKEAYAAALREAKRACDFGFTATEYARYKDDFLSSYEKKYTNRDKMTNEQYTQQYVDNFCANEPIPSISDEYMLFQQLASAIPVEAVNMAAKEMISESDTNFVSLVMMREQDGAVYPTADELKAVVNGVRGEKLEAYVDNVKQEPLIAQLPKAGKVKKTIENKTLGYKMLTLSNGAKVVLKKTDFKDDEIKFYASAEGGKAAFDTNDVNEARVMDNVLEACGLGNFTNSELEKNLAGKQAASSFRLGMYTHGLEGSTTPKDIETLLQLVYLQLTNVNRDDKSIRNTLETQASLVANQSNNPNSVFNDSVASTIYGGNKIVRAMTAEEIGAVNVDRVMELASQLYGNVKDYTFYFVGNIDEATLLPLVKQYIASLPSNGKQFKNRSLVKVKGEIVNKYDKEMANPQNMAIELWYSNTPLTLKNEILADIAARVLGMDYNRNIRERLSAAYYAGANSATSMTFDKKLETGVMAIAMLNPDKSEEAVKCFYTGLEQTRKAPNADDLQKVKEILLKQSDVNAKTNGYWMEILSDYIDNGVDGHTDYKTTVSAVDAQSLADFINQVILKDGNHVEVIMNAKAKQ